MICALCTAYHYHTMMFSGGSYTRAHASQRERERVAYMINTHAHSPFFIACRQVYEYNHRSY